MPFDPVPEDRKVHYLRVFGTNRAGDVLPEMWVDLERIDQWETTTQDHGHWQQVQYNFRWFDEPDHVDQPETRKTRIVKYYSVRDYPNLDPVDPDPDEWVPIEVVTKFEATKSDQEIAFRLLNDSLVDFRIYQRRRFPHYDTTMDEEIDQAAANDPTLKQFYIEQDKYEKIEGTKDEDVGAVENAVVLKHFSNASGQTGMIPTTSTALAIALTSSVGTDEEVTFKFNNTYLINNSEPSRLEDGVIAPKRRIDPFQNIVNSKFTALPQVVLSSSGLGLFGNQVSRTEYSQDGTIWKDLSSSSYSAASGLGYTVIAGTGKQIVYGKPRDGASCFIYIDGTTAVKRGVLDHEGNLEWTTVKVLAQNANTVSFAGGAFFVSYQTNADSWLAVSFDGEDFNTIVNPFGRAPIGYNDNTGSPAGGTVAYDAKNKLYVTCGSFSWSYQFFYFPGTPDVAISNSSVEQNFMSATSRDGVNWANKKFDKSQATGPSILGEGIVPGAIGAGAVAPTVAFGKGVFVAATWMKWRYFDNAVTPPSLVFMETLAGFATSRNGITWTNNRLPNSTEGHGTFAEHLGAINSFSNCVQFYKTGGTTDDGYPKGFFILGVREEQLGLGSGPESVSGVINPIHKQKMYRSEDGFNWKLVRTVNNQSSYPLVLSMINKHFDPETAQIERV